MEQWTEIRRKVLVEKVSKRQIRRDYRIGAATLDKVLEHPEPPGYRAREVRYKPKLGPFTAVIDEILDGRRSFHAAASSATPQTDLPAAPRRAPLPGLRVQVRRYVALARRHSAEVFVPLSHPPGEPSSTSVRRPSRSRACVERWPWPS